MKRVIMMMGVVLLAGCGFTPMYANPETSNIIFKKIDITSRSSNSERGAYYLDNALRQRLEATQGATKSAELIVASGERTVDLGISQSDASSRQDLYLIVGYTLKIYDDTGNPLPPISGKFTSVATFSIPNSPYAQNTLLDDARQRAAEDAADRIARDIAFKLHGK